MAWIRFRFNVHLFCAVAPLTLALVQAMAPIPLVTNWDSVYRYNFEYERIRNGSDDLVRRITFAAAVHFRKDLDNPNAVLAFFEQPMYDHNDMYHRNPYFRETVEGLTLPFRINYHTNGLLYNVVTHENDSDLSAKFKKTVASLVQIDWGYINHMTSRRFFDYNFTTPETTIFGDCDVVNHVNQVGEGRILSKDILLHTCIRGKPFSRSSLTVEFKFMSSREQNFHFVNLNGIEYVPGSDSYSILTQRLEFMENIKALVDIDSRWITVNRLTPL